MDNIIIRNIEEKDIPIVVDIQIDSWKTAYRGIIDNHYLKSMNRDKIIEKHRNNYKENGFIIAELNNEVVGFCRYADNNKFSENISDINCEILALYVKPNLKYNGIGTKLFQFVINEFKAKDKTKMILWCLKDNEPSKQFYKKMGGKIKGEKVILIDNKKYYEVGFKYNI